MTSLHYAAKAGHLEVVKHLIEAGANTTYETKDGRIPLCHAASNSHNDVLSFLFSKEHDTHMLMDDKKVICTYFFYFVLLMVISFFYKIFGRHESFCGATDTPVLDFW